MKPIRAPLLFSVLFALTGAAAAAAPAPELDNALTEQEMVRQVPRGLTYGQEIPANVSPEEPRSPQSGSERPSGKG